MEALLTACLLINLLAFVQMGVDKRLAVNHKPRISEALLIAPVLFSGIIGAVLGMLAFRHKTRKRSFQIKLALAFCMFCGGIVYFTVIVQP